VRAGFPSPAEDYVEAPLDLNEHLVKHPAATFFVRAEGDWMRGAGIHSGDILIVDRSLPPSIGRVVVAAVDGQFTVKRLKRSPDGSVYLAPENDAYGAIPVRDESVQVWGVVTHVIHQP
jgi:DNA polymerase V